MTNLTISKMDFENVVLKNGTVLDYVFKSTNTEKPCYLQYVPTVGWTASIDDGDNSQEEYFGDVEDSMLRAGRWLATEVTMFFNPQF